MLMHGGMQGLQSDCMSENPVVRTHEDRKCEECVRIFRRFLPLAI